MEQPALNMRQVRKLGSERLQEPPRVTQQVGKRISPPLSSPGSSTNTTVCFQEMMQGGLPWWSSG